MAKQYTCDVCGETMTDDMETRLVERVQEHEQQEHDLDMSAVDIREGIEDT